MEDQIPVSNSSQRIDLISSLFGEQIASDILNNDHNPTIYDPNNTCPHRVFLANICTNCGVEIENTNSISTTQLWYVYPRLSVSRQEINRLRDGNLQRLLSRKKLHLVIDLDHTLLHKRDKLTPEDKKFMRSKIDGIDRNTLFKMSCGWVKLRPYVRTFLQQASIMFDMTIYTLSGRATAWSIAKMLDPEGVYFDMWRVISIDDCVGVKKHKKSLDFILEHEKVVVVLDDSEVAWEDYKANYLKVIPYNFFSYYSPDNKLHDTSPPRESWSQLNADESEDNGVLAKILAKLRMVHASYYEDDGSQDNDYESRDVREVLKKVKIAEIRKQGNRKAKKKNGKVLLPPSQSKVLG